jgi:hypothetical protein
MFGQSAFLLGASLLVTGALLGAEAPAPGDTPAPPNGRTHAARRGE